MWYSTGLFAVPLRWVLMLIEENPNRLCYPAGWICDAVWAQGLVEYLQEPEDLRRALNARAKAAS